MLCKRKPSSNDHFTCLAPEEDVPTDLVRLWVCRAVLGSAFNAVIGQGSKAVDSRNSDVAEVRTFLGLPSNPPESADEVTIERKRLIALQKKLEKRNDLENGTMYRNLAMLGRRIGFSPLDQRSKVLGLSRLE